MTDQTRARRSSLDNIVKPASVAIIGASGTRPDATGNQVIRNLRSGAFAGRIEVVNPAGGCIEGIDAVTRSGDVGPVDLAIIAVAPRSVVAALRGAHDAGAAAALVMSVGMDDAQLAELREFALGNEMLVHGPNCMGLINVTDDVMLWADEGNLTGLPRGPVAIVSQSGSGAIFVARSMSAAGFSNIVSTGTEAITSTADYIDYLVDDESTGVIGIIIETVGPAERFTEAVGRARAAGKPVVALKVGRSRAGALATIAHTGAMMAEDSIVSAYFASIGVPLVRDYDELAATLEVLAHLRERSFGDGRIAAITISGGQAALAADLADSLGASLAPLSDTTRSRLSAVLPGAGINNPLDAGGSETVDDGWYGDCLELLASDPAVDVVLVITDSQATLNDVEISYEDELVESAREVAARHRKPFVMASSSSVSLHVDRVSPPEHQFPAVRGIANALSAIVSATIALAPTPATQARPRGLPQEGEVMKLRAELSAASGQIDNLLGAQLLDSYGIATPPSVRTASIEEAVAWAGSAGYPVVLKIDSPDIPHRTEVEGVVVGIATPEELRTRWSAMFDRVRELRPDARVLGGELQAQLTGSIEAIIGAVSDPDLGSTVGVGMGGVLVELLRDTESTLAPASPDTARATLARTRLRQLLDGYRGINPVINDESLIDAFVRVSWLMHDLRGLITEFEANPVLVDARSGAVYAVDVLLVRGEAG
ncbi:acetate--CoA ligase family protein [Microbacterium sp. PMB16]|uniref:acetate--CoA ligase family protein n=1 Tax=Microbacterium sp. PMB16 TaxID=3120157 RepID=UPI003F4BDC64